MWFRESLVHKFALIFGPVSSPETLEIIIGNYLVQFMIRHFGPKLLSPVYASVPLFKLWSRDQRTGEMKAKNKIEQTLFFAACFPTFKLLIDFVIFEK